MATAPSDSPYAPLTVDLIRRERDIDTIITLRRPPFPRRGELAENARLFTVTWAGGFVFFMTFLG
ncbi:hypothetical protein HFP57_06185 [Parasphingopyxis algicola]|uniref:hypothetical protein n=1 Tax=Parasphingopyxis algicola TaxID=2026624 RepID=UPI00159FA791|nr:hypothetical protein [Parasphingopyxis algicola]QLC24660.1 hypothetical protein HFP57_06185 [Parasphingopyxis algicola]